jgi:aspartate/methionine/tyrosine aminotransferase
MGEVMALIALNHKEKFIEPNLRKIRRNIKLFNEFQSEHQAFLIFPPPKGGSTAFVKLNIEESTLEYCRRLIEKTGIMLLPSEMFDYGDKHVRIGFGRENMPEILQRWGDYIRDTV